MEEKKVTIKLKRHLWEDERADRRRQNRLITMIVALMLVAGSLGFLVGRMEAIGNVQGETISHKRTKLERMQNIMNHKWYFSSMIEEVDQKIMDKAYYGMTSFEEDKHTSYMSQEEVELFTSHIDMGFVGIGVQYSEDNGSFVVQKVFKDSPAEKAGVLAGDVFIKVDGVSLEGLTSEEISKMVKGMKGTVVSIEFLRQGNPIVIDITRDEVNNTAYGYMLDEDTGYLEIYSFGSETGKETGVYLKDLNQKGMKNLIIDLRDNGGGYLNTLVDVASHFLQEDTLVIKQVYSNGHVENGYTKGNRIVYADRIVILINHQTASAAEVLALSLKEQYPNTILVGEKSYGKGTVQTTEYFEDGSALKYTTSKWTSPNGIWVNDLGGIEPDVAVKLHDYFYLKVPNLEESSSYEVDSVSDYAKVAQYALDYLGYQVLRKDGYFDVYFKDTLNQYKLEHNLETDGILNRKTLDSIISSVRKNINSDKKNDAQLMKAMELIDGF